MRMATLSSGRWLLQRKLYHGHHYDKNKMTWAWIRVAYPKMHCALSSCSQQCGQSRRVFLNVHVSAHVHVRWVRPRRLTRPQCSSNKQLHVIKQALGARALGCGGLEASAQTFRCQMGARFFLAHARSDRGGSTLARSGRSTLDSRVRQSTLSSAAA